jgi:hypothetical protein
LIFPWLIFGLLFLVPFVDPRRPFRLLHLDLLVLLVVGFGPLTFYVVFEQPRGSAVVAMLGLTYLAGRLLYMGFRPPGPQGRLVPLLSYRWLLVLLIAIVGFRYAYVAGFDRLIVHDVGIASIIGADRIGRGEELYASKGDEDYYPHWDTYGPANYLYYVPFEQALPWKYSLIGKSGYDDPDAARIATLFADALVLVGLGLLGTRLRQGKEGRLLGVALAYAWATYPYALFEVRYDFNNTLVALFVLASFLALALPAARGALSAIAGATKFGPLVLAPLFATGTGERRTRSWLLFSAAFVAVTLALYLPLLPPGGASELWDRTLAFQGERQGWNTLSARFSGIEWLHSLAYVAVGALAVLLAFRPRRRSAVQVAALGGGVMAALELSMKYWFSSYIVWLVPLAFAALFAFHDCRTRSMAPTRVEGSPRAEDRESGPPPVRASAP